MSYYALTDSDWPWDDEHEGRALVVRADTPEEAVKVATEKHIKEFPGAGGICWKVARLWNVGLEMVDWEDDNKPKYDGFTYYPPGSNGPLDLPPEDVTTGSSGAPIRQKSDVPTDVNDMPEGECAHDWFDCSNAHVPPPAKSCRKCGWTVGDNEARGIYLIWPWLEAERKERERANADI